MSRWPLQLVTSLICFECLFCIRLPCNQTYEAKNGHLCYPCSLGYYTVSDCVVDGDQARCRRCGNGEYQPNCDNSPKCASCRPFCPPGQEKVKDCDAISDIECQCKSDSFWKPDAAKSKEGHCKRHSQCRPGEGRVQIGTPLQDTKCEPCREGVSYSDNLSLDSCITCTVCSTTVIDKCSATQNTVCSDQVPQRPSHTKHLSKGLDDGAIAGIVTGCTVFLLLAVALVIALICRCRRKNGLNSNTDSPNDDLSDINENSNSETQSGVAVNQTETPGDILVYKNEEGSVSDINVNGENDHSDENEVDSVKSYATLKQSQHGFENEAFDSQSCTEFKTHEGSENNVIQNAQAVKCYPSPQTTGYTSEINTHLVNDNDPNIHLDSSDIQTESSDENMEEEDANEQMQFPDKPKQSDYELKNTDSSQSSNKNALPTENIDTPLEGKITSGNENIKDDQLGINNGEDTNVSIDAAAVSSRNSLQCGGPNREGVTEESMTEETGSGIRRQIECNFEDEISEKTCRSVDRSYKERMWFEITAFISRSLLWDEFHSFIMQLVANTNGELLKTINVEINHIREEEKSIKSIIYKVMNTWRQATPAATVHCVNNALKECSLNLKCEELEETLEQKGLLDRINSSFQYMSGQNEETAQKHYLSPVEGFAQNHHEIHEMNELKENN